MNKDWTGLYALQDEALKAIRPLDHSLYLTGGTALSRGYCRHRYSEDLDLFANDRAEFPLWRDRCISALRAWCDRKGFRLEVTLREDRFGRLFVHGPTALKVEFVNDVPCRVGAPWMHPELGLLDTRENILANKISALVDRRAPKDLADLFWLCVRDGMSVMRAIEDASGKAAGIFPPLVAKVIETALPGAWESVPWIDAPEKEAFEKGLVGLAREIMELDGE
jgi:hypothetical protein